MVKFESEEDKKVVPEKKIIVEEKIPEEIIGEDEFSKKERENFAKICPDINLEVGLKYCMDSKSFMVQMLTTFADGKKADKIEEKFAAQDWKNYQIMVHALKSTSLSIGAEKLSEEAKNLELAAKNSEIDKILANHAGLMADYKKIREEIGEWLENEQNISS